MPPEIDPGKVHQLGLDPDRIVEHQTKIKAQLETGQGIVFPIQESGTLANGTVLSLDPLDTNFLTRRGQEGLEAGELCSFVPAAGAASRYLRIFDALRAARQAGADDRVKTALRALQDLGNLSDLPFEVPCPPQADPAALEEYGLSIAERYGAMPKGLMPATQEGLSFLELKLLEHAKLNPSGTLAVVVADGQTERFEKHLETSSVGKDLQGRLQFLVQGKPLSTVRFEADGSAVHTEEGDYAPVVAGHGELLRLFPEVAARSQARSIFIINVDNIIGTQPEVVTAFQKMFGFHRELLSFLDELRDACQKRELSDLRDRRIRGLGSMLGLQLPAEGGPALLLGLQVGLFHSGSELQWTAAEELWPALQRLYHRPLTVHGLVPNTGEDAGAIPAFIDLDGQRIKICLEMPHATPEDQTTYFKNPEKATHFNPVFVLHELRPEVPPEHRTDPRFWMLTKKPYEGRQVYYHETVLYEAIGNSLTNNIVFVEIPRFLFNPHKEFTDCRGRTAASYGFEQQPES